MAKIKVPFSNIENKNQGFLAKERQDSSSKDTTQNNKDAKNGSTDSNQENNDSKDNKSRNGKNNKHNKKKASKQNADSSNSNTGDQTNRSKTKQKIPELDKKNKATKKDFKKDHDLEQDNQDQYRINTASNGNQNDIKKASRKRGMAKNLKIKAKSDNKFINNI